MPIFRRRPRHDHGAEPPTTAELRAEREADWARVFAGAADEGDYRRTFLRYSPLLWDIVQSTQGDLLRLLVGRVPAEMGVAAIFAVTVLFAHHGKPDDAARATLATIVHDLAPAHARTLLVALADAWHNAERRAYEERSAVVAAEFGTALRRLQATGAEETGAISAIAEQLEEV